MNTEAQLAPREYEITGYMALGATKKEIANHLGISVRTVENTARNVYVKTEVRNVAELAGWWYSRKFKIPALKNPLLSILFLLLVTINEIKGDVFPRRVRATSSRTAKVKGKRKN